MPYNVYHFSVLSPESPVTSFSLVPEAHHTLLQEVRTETAVITINYSITTYYTEIKLYSVYHPMFSSHHDQLVGFQVIYYHPLVHPYHLSRSLTSLNWYKAIATAASITPEIMITQAAPRPTPVFPALAILSASSPAVPYATT